MSRIGVEVAVFFVVIVAAAGCGGEGTSTTHSDKMLEGPGVTVLGGKPPENTIAGQTIYVPVYAYLHINDDGKPFNLATTLYIRNTDPKRAVVVKSVDYHGSSGSLIRSFLKSPIRLGPLATTSVFVKQSDSSAGSSTSFLVEWLAEEQVSPPVVEAVMVGTLVNQGLALTVRGEPIGGRRE